MNKSFAISNNILMNKSTLMMYTDYLLNKCYQFKTANAVGTADGTTGRTIGDKPGGKIGSPVITLFCSVYCDDCNGSCVNSRYSLVKPLNNCSKMCNENV